MMHMPIAHRLAARRAVEEGREGEALIQKYHNTMTRVFGGEYWKAIMLAPDLTPEEREIRLIKAYEDKLAGYMPFTGSCPVREGSNARIKYFAVFASRHPDAMLLMHDAMTKAYFKRMHEHEFAGTLFESNDWGEMLSATGLREIIIGELTKRPGLTREELWLQIVQKNFMRYRKSDFSAIVQELVDGSILNCPTRRRTKRLNEHCALYVA